MQKLLTFFSKNIGIYAILNDQSFNDTLTNDFVSFEQLGPIEWTVMKQILRTMDGVMSCYIIDADFLKYS